MGAGQGQAWMRDETTRRKSRPERSRCTTTEAALRSSPLRLHTAVGALGGADQRRSRHPGRGTAITGDGLGPANAPNVSQLRPPLTAPRDWEHQQGRAPAQTRAEHDPRASCHSRLGGRTNSIAARVWRAAKIASSSVRPLARKFRIDFKSHRWAHTHTHTTPDSQLRATATATATATCDGILGSDLPDGRIIGQPASQPRQQHVLVLSGIACSGLPMDATIASADHGRRPCGLACPRNLLCVRKTAAKGQAKSQATRGLTHVSSSAATAECWATLQLPPNLPASQRWTSFFLRATTYSRSLPTLGCFRIGRGAGSPPRSSKKRERARDGTLFRIRAAVGQHPMNSPDAVAGSSGRQEGPDERQHSCICICIWFSKGRGKRAD